MGLALSNPLLLPSNACFTHGKEWGWNYGILTYSAYVNIAVLMGSWVWADPDSQKVFGSLKKITLLVILNL